MPLFRRRLRYVDDDDAIDFASFKPTDGRRRNRA
jgi:hypothetical protein